MLPWGLLLFTDSEKSATHRCLTHPNSFSVCDEFKQAIFLRIIGSTSRGPARCKVAVCGQGGIVAVDGSSVVFVHRGESKRKPKRAERN